MSISEEKNVILKKEYYEYSLGNCQQAKLNTTIQNIPMPPRAFKEQSSTSTMSMTEAAEPLTGDFTAAADEFGCLSTASRRAHFNS